MEIPASQAGFTAASCWEQRVTRDERQLILWFTNNATRTTRDSRQRLMCCHLDNDKRKQKKRTKRKLPRDEGEGGRKPVLPSPPLAAWPPFARLHPPPPSAQTYRRSQRAIFAKVPGSYEMAVPMASFDSLRGILLFRLLQFPRACATYSIITHAEMRISAPRKGRGKKRRRYPEYVSFTREASARINATHIYIAYRLFKYHDLATKSYYLVIEEAYKAALNSFPSKLSTFNRELQISARIHFSRLY